MPRQNQIDPKVRGSRPFDGPSNIPRSISPRPVADNTLGELAQELIAGAGVAADIKLDQERQRRLEEDRQSKLTAEAEEAYRNDVFLSLAEAKAKYAETNLDVDKKTYIAKLRNAAENENLDPKARTAVNNTLASLMAGIREDENREDVREQANLYTTAFATIESEFEGLYRELTQGVDLTDRKENERIKAEMSQFLASQLDTLDITDDGIRAGANKSLLGQFFGKLDHETTSAYEDLGQTVAGNQVRGALTAANPAFGPTEMTFGETLDDLVNNSQIDPKTVFDNARSYMNLQPMGQIPLGEFRKNVQEIRKFAYEHGETTHLDSFVRQQYNRIAAHESAAIQGHIQDLGTTAATIVAEKNAEYEDLGVRFVIDTGAFEPIDANDPEAAIIAGFLDQSAGQTLRRYMASGSGKEIRPGSVAPGDITSTARKFSNANRVQNQALSKNERSQVKDDLIAKGFGEAAKVYEQFGFLSDDLVPNFPEIMHKFAQDDANWIYSQRNSWGDVGGLIADYMDDNTEGGASYINGIVQAAGINWRQILTELDSNETTAEELAFVVSGFAVANDETFSDVIAVGGENVRKFAEEKARFQERYANIKNWMKPVDLRKSDRDIDDAPAIVKALADKMGLDKWRVFEDKALLVNMVQNRAPEGSRFFDDAVDDVLDHLDNNPFGILNLENNRIALDYFGTSSRAWTEGYGTDFDGAFKNMFVTKRARVQADGSVEIEPYSFLPGPLRGLVTAGDAASTALANAAAEGSSSYPREDLATQVAYNRYLADKLGVVPQTTTNTQLRETVGHGKVKPQASPDVTKTLLTYLDQRQLLTNMDSAREVIESGQWEIAIDDDGSALMILNFAGGSPEENGFENGVRTIRLITMEGFPVTFNAQDDGPILVNRDFSKHQRPTPAVGPIR